MVPRIDPCSARRLGAFVVALAIAGGRGLTSATRIASTVVTARRLTVATITARQLVVVTVIAMAFAADANAQRTKLPPIARPDDVSLPGDGGEPLTLATALQLAVRHDQGLAQAEMSLAQRRLRMHSSLAAYLPSLSASLGSTAFAATTVTGEDDFGRPRRLDSPMEYSGSASYQSVGASWTLFDGGRRWSDYQEARASTRAAHARMRAEHARAMADATRLFYQAVRAALLLRFERQTLDAAADQRVASERLFRMAATSYADLLGSTAQEADQRHRVRIAELTLHRARLHLASALGIHPSNIIALDTVLPAIVNPRALEAAPGSSSGIGQHPFIAAADAEVAMAERRLDALRASMWPQVNVGASAARSVSLSSDAALGVLDPQNRSYSLGITVSLPVFSRLHGMVNRQEAALELERARLSRDRTRAGLQAEIDDAWLSLHEAWERAQSADESARLQRERAEMEARRYASGAVSFTEFQATVERAAAAERGIRESRISFAIALAVLEQRTGSPFSR